VSKRRGRTLISVGVPQTLRNKRSATSFVFALVLVAVLPGCGQRNSPARLPIYGTVTLAGGEKPNGSISFVPDDGNSGPAAMTALAEGRYQFNETNGPTPGPHKVIVRQLVLEKRIPGPSTGDVKSEATKSVGNEAKSAAKTEWKLNANLTNSASGPYDFTLEP
jgi:hypothetical protein